MKINYLIEPLKIPAMVTLRAVPMAVRDLQGFYLKKENSMTENVNLLIDN